MGSSYRNPLPLRSHSTPSPTHPARTTPPRSSMTDDLEYVMEGTRGELARFVEALKHSGIAGHVRPKNGCPPTS